MRQRIVLATGFATALIIVIFLIRSFLSYDIRNSPPKNNVIIAFGDSLVEGVGSTYGGGFVSLLESSLNRPIENMGVSGNTTRDALVRLEADVLAKDPGVVIVLLGGNDYLKRIPKEETFENLRTIADAIQNQDGIVVLLGVRGGILSDSYETLYRDLARDTGSIYVPNVLDGLIGNSEYMYDAIHPNDTGYRLIAEKILRELDTLF